MHTNLKDKLKVLRLAVRKEYFYEIKAGIKKKNID